MSRISLLTRVGLLLAMIPATPSLAGTDPRDIRSGIEIPDEGYCDQPYVVVLDDGRWLCVMTTGKGVEGQGGQHVVSVTSADQGKTWSKPVDIEPASGPEASWAVPLKTPGGRVYAFYTYNADNLREVKGSGPKPIKRVDTLGKYAFKYTDNGGQSWSAQRFYLPMRTTEIDRKNPYEGKIHFFWGVCKPIVDRGEVFFGASKVQSFGVGFMEVSEGIVFRSDNVLGEKDPAKIQWEMLPDGDVGLRAPKGPVCDEHNLVALSDGTLYCIARTTQGSPVQYYSHDRGHTWTAPQFATYGPDGPPIRHPRANCHLWKCANGKYLLWFHNHGGKDYADRNPAWILGGIEKEGKVYWSQPEVLLYDADPKVRMSYPDLIEQDGKYWITETQKTVARVHSIDPALLEGMWGQFGEASVAQRGVLADLAAPSAAPPLQIRLPSLADGGGFTLDVQMKLPVALSEQVILGSIQDGKGVRLMLTEAGTVRLEMGDGKNRTSWDCDGGLLKAGNSHHVTAIVDGGPKIISFVVDGRFCDGGSEKEPRQFGWGRFDAKMGDVSQNEISVAKSFTGRVEHLRLYDRYLRISEAVGNWRADAAVHKDGK